MMTNSGMNDILLLVIAMLLLAASWIDIVSRRIPNSLVVAIAVLWITSSITTEFMDVIWSILTAASVLGIGTLVWRLGWLGGGDVKLIAVLSLWAGPALTPEFLLAIGASGGVLAAACLAARRAPFAPLLAYLHVAIHRFVPATARTVAATLPRRIAAGSNNETIPYGVAVAAGGCWLVHRLLVS